MVSGAITMSVFVSRALSKFISHPALEIMINPITVFILFLIAALVVFYPWLRGVKALIMMPFIVLFIAFFVYAYYIVP